MGQVHTSYGTVAESCAALEGKCDTATGIISVPAGCKTEQSNVYSDGGYNPVFTIIPRHLQPNIPLSE